MPTLGEELRRKREERAITLAEISESTRIGTRFLKAIETDNFSTLPGGIFTRSFIRAYAKQVGMNEDEAIALYQEQVSEPPDEPQPESPQTAKASKPGPAPPKQPATEFKPRRYEPVTFRQSPRRTSWPTIIIGAGILLFVAIIVIGIVRQLNRAGSEAAPAPVAQKDETPKATPPQTPSPAQPDPSQTPPAAPNGEPLVVKLEAATGDVWIRYQVDDAQPTTLVLRQGQTTDIPPAQTQVTLNLGNRTTLKMKINNREASFPADTPKFSSRVIISRDNLQTFLQ
ncbi:MAG TPA: RodZ domain-containing protein [Blastocatellia bacterium]|jgi:cytoskeletal protein RodZ|nr:RodZ domain-containing protein [Blastocatellia bacterium]